MNVRATAIARVCDRLGHGDLDSAAAILHADYPFEAPTNAGRNYAPHQMTAVFLRDGFVDRYSGDRLVFPAVLRVISVELPTSFPFQKNWKMSETHNAYWDLCPTIDHVTPVARGGTDDEANWVTTSMAHNAAKGNSSLEQIGWRLHPRGNIADWDGMAGWLCSYLGGHPELLADKYISRWANALTAQYSP